MTMHLAHPALTITGKRRGRAKFRSAQEAQRARELEQSWLQLQNRWQSTANSGKQERNTQPLVQGPRVPPGRETPRLPSLDTGGPHVTAPVHKVYTGDKVLGVTIVHKSCLQPVFSQQEAIDAANMRR